MVCELRTFNIFTLHFASYYSSAINHYKLSQRTAFVSLEPVMMILSAIRMLTGQVTSNLGEVPAGMCSRSTVAASVGEARSSELWLSRRLKLSTWLYQKRLKKWCGSRRS